MAEQANLQAGLQQVGDTIKPQMDGALANLDKLVAAANKFAYIAAITPGLGPVAIWWIRANLEDIKKGVREAIKLVNHLLQHYMPVISLIMASFRWTSEVRPPLSDLEFEAERADNRMFRQWEGDAADEYKDIAKEQKEALHDVSEKSEFVSKWLLTIARENVAFAKKMYEFVVDLLEILAKAVSQAVMANVPFAIDDAAELIGTAVGNTLRALGEIAERLVANIGNARDLVAASGDRSKLSSRRWPDAVTVQ